ncbi:MAG: DNA mismatch repair endonuclease MutL [Deltaproteobacteria bacterium]|nr:DNA mismatch repair endonuclease MutL [Deltaproteobacteria bacterium]
MSVVALLPPEVANQIAAGEVVERPASVMKELVENALDAGATTITVSIDGGGLARVAVTDDGGGMSPEDVALALLRHATSKIRSADDLVGVGTYGFRGEALPSIASVSRTRVTTRARGTAEGSEALVEGGAPAALRPAGCAEGTTVCVEDLFYNTPARRKFMRTPQTEGAACIDGLVRLAIPKPEVRFVVRRDGKVVREFLRHSDVAARVREVLADEPLAELRGSRGKVRVVGLLGPPERARSGASHLMLYVNGRHVKDRLLLRAVAQAYGSTLESGRYPAGAVLVEVPPEDVDVNVHPQKTEVRFASQGAIFEAVMSVLRDAAASAPWAHAATRPRDFWAEHLSPGPSAQTPIPSVLSASTASPPPRDEPARPLVEAQVLSAFVTAAPDAADPWARLAAAPYPPAAYADAARASVAPAVGEGRVVDAAAVRSELHGSTFGALRYVGQLRRMFLLCEGESGVVILDQHAAAERVTFERLRRSYQARSVPMQPLLVPERVELAADEVALVEERAEELLSVGLDLAPLGPTTVAVRAVPAMLLRADPRRLARDLIAELARQGNDFSKAVDLVLATMACHGSVRGGDEMAPEEVRALLQALDTVDFAGHCPHGRPVVYTLRWGELERKVGR